MSRLAAGEVADDRAGVLYVGGSIITMDPRRPGAQAVATRAGRIVAVGSEADCRRSIGMSATPGNDTNTGDAPGAPRVVDLGSRALLPGFHDVHLHPLPMAFYEHHLDLTPCVSVKDVLDAIGDRVRRAGPGEWVMGVQIDHEKLDEKRLPTRQELDSLSEDVPIVLFRRDGHTAMGSSAALRGAQITEQTPDPEGGAFGRESDGSLSGLCFESAAQALIGAVPVPSIDALRDATRRVFERLVANGITSAGVVLQTDSEGPAGESGALETIAMQMFLDEVPIAINAILAGADIDKALALRDSQLHDPASARRVEGIKIYLDGTLGARTARMHQPYSDDDSQSGMFTIARDECARRMEEAHLAGLQICVHAIGDAANDSALDLFAELKARHPDDAPTNTKHRIEHASVLSRSAVERFAELGVVAAVQPLFIRSERQWLPLRLGPDRVKWVYPFRSLRAAGVTVAGASDAPIEDTSVLAAIHTCVTRNGFETQECIDATEALRLYTSSAADASLTADEVGTITEGKRADLVLLTRDPTAAPADHLLSIEVDLTVSAGREVYARSAAQLGS
ncbi:MAG: hypothetical protein DCC49_07590 [Acidobacteria bacterium]|nr:MAG: hypothetical protein DCC49_07590 [Acidobacteriota bacterium]